MEDILQKILKEGSSEKFAHISTRAHKAYGEKYLQTYFNRNKMSN